jgi:hypothetical protein
VGVSTKMPFELSRRVKRVNVFAFLASVTTLPYVFIFFNEGTILGPLALFFLACFVGTWFWNKLGKFKTAKYWLYIFSYLYLFSLASTLGKVYLIGTLLAAVLV